MIDPGAEMAIRMHRLTNPRTRMHAGGAAKNSQAPLLT